MSNQVEIVEAESFDRDVLHANRPVLVDLYADWCGPCQAIAPVVAELAQEYQGRVDVTKVNVDSSPELTRGFNIRGIPTLVLFRNGAVAGSIAGAASKGALSAFIESHIA